MKIVVFSGDSSHVVNAPEGTVIWNIMNSDGSKSQSNVEKYALRIQDSHKFVYVAIFRDVDERELEDAVMKHGYNV